MPGRVQLAVWFRVMAATVSAFSSRFPPRPCSAASDRSAPSWRGMRRRAKRRPLAIGHRGPRHTGSSCRALVLLREPPVAVRPARLPVWRDPELASFMPRIQNALLHDDRTACRSRPRRDRRRVIPAVEVRHPFRLKRRACSISRVFPASCAAAAARSSSAGMAQQIAYGDGFDGAVRSSRRADSRTPAGA